MKPSVSLRALAVCLMLAAVSACSESEPPPAAAAETGPSVPPGHVVIGELPDIDMPALLEHTKRLSSDQFEGRLPGTRGEELTVAYLIDQFKKVGLKPGNTDGTYVQKVPLVGITAAPAPLVVKKESDEQAFTWRDEVVAWTKHVAPTAAIADSELVFVGYGVVAPEYDWDDYKGFDVKGKTLVMLVNDPPVLDPADPSQLDVTVFGGRAMTYYGRWTYKFEIAAEKGAAAALLIHETGPAGYPFQVVQDGFTGERFDLVTPDKNMSRSSIEAWLSLDAGKKLLELGGQDFDVLKEQAATRDFTPVPLGVTASMALKNTLKTIDSQNVIARLEGSDSARKAEHVIYTAHWDHFGKRDEGIFHGARDNAVGTAALIEVARAFTKLPSPPRRSILFLAVTAEEQGLLGSEYYSVTPIYPLAKMVANINMDSWNLWGRTKDLTVVGFGASDLDDYVRDAAAEQGRIVQADPEPEKGNYYRSDHFAFAKQGVPALNPEGGTEYLGRPADYGKQVRDDWTANRYHKPADVVLPNWDLTGAHEDLKVYFAVGYRVAQADRFPEWKPGNEFKARRDAMLKSGRQ
ncbi:MAG TPA: M28 family peptidase [Vicinamibacterales bacterium]|nr:M28 family peptidase [Vicinamibacterales bacterium]